MNQSPSVFISRKLAPESPVREWAKAKGIHCVAKSLLRFKSVSFRRPKPKADWIFFYSPRAVEFFLAQKRKTSSMRLAAMGGGTAKALLAHKKKVDFCGKGSPERVAEDFVRVAYQQTVWFPRATQSRRSIERILVNDIKAVDFVVYKNKIAPRPDLPATDIVVLTSPLNVEAYFTHQMPKETTHYIAIGPSTASAYTAYGITAEVTPRPDEESLLECLEKYYR